MFVFSTGTELAMFLFSWFPFSWFFGFCLVYLEFCVILVFKWFSLISLWIITLCPRIFFNGTIICGNINNCCLKDQFVPNIFLFLDIIIFICAPLTLEDDIHLGVTGIVWINHIWTLWWIAVKVKKILWQKEKLFYFK